jgi:hypothetical protein
MGKRLSFFASVNIGSGTHIASYPVHTAANWLGHWGDHSSPSCWELNNAWSSDFTFSCYQFIVSCTLHETQNLSFLKKWFMLQYIIFILSGVWDWVSPLGTAATTGLLYQPQMIDDGECGQIGRMKIGRGNQSTRRKPAPAPLCPPQIPHDQIWSRTWATTLGSQWLTAWAMVRPLARS